MNHRRLGATNLLVSEVALGALELGAQYGIGPEAAQLPSEDQAIQLMRAAWDDGINFFDTAGAYALSERRIGSFIKATGLRPVLASKLQVSPGQGAQAGQWLDYTTRRPFPSIKACIDHQVRRCLTNLGVDRLDLMQHHGLSADDHVLHEMTEALQAHVRAGRIGYLGASCSTQDLPRLAAAGGGGYSAIQIMYNILAQAERGAGLELARQHGVGVLVRIPLALGVLAGKVERLDEERRRRFQPFLDDLASRLPPGMSLPEAALRFILSSPQVTTVLVGTKNADHVRQAAAAGDGRGLPADVLQWLYALGDRGGLPAWTWAEHYQKDWPSGSGPANDALCRSVDVEAP